MGFCLDQAAPSVVDFGFFPGSSPSATSRSWLGLTYNTFGTSDLVCSMLQNVQEDDEAKILKFHAGSLHCPDDESDL